MKPSIGRIVHFVGQLGTEPRSHYAAIITHVHSDTCVNLQVFPKASGMDDQDAGVKTSVLLDEAAGNSFGWHWPEREE